MDAKVKQVYRRQLKGLKVYGTLTTDYMDQKGRRIQGNRDSNLRDVDLDFLGSYSNVDWLMDDANIVVIEGELQQRGRIFSENKVKTDAKYTVLIISDGSEYLNKGDDLEDITDMFHPISSANIIELSIKESELQKVKDVVDKLPESDGMLLFRHVNTRVLEPMPMEQAMVGSAYGKIMCSDRAYKVLEDIVKLPIFGSYEAIPELMTYIRHKATIDQIKNLLSRKDTPKPQDVDLEQIVVNIGKFADESISKLQKPVFTFPDFTVRKDAFGRPVVDSIGMFDSNTVDKESVEKARREWNDFYNEYELYDARLSEFESIRRVVNAVMQRDRHVLKRLYSNIANILTGFQCQKEGYYGFKSGNKFVTAIFHPKVNINPKFDPEIVEEVLYKDGHRVFLNETDDGYEYTSYQTDSAIYSLFLLAPAFIDVETAPIIALEDKAKELIEVLRGKIQRHKDTKIDFSSCTINNVSTYVEDRFSRIQFMLQLLSNCVATLKLIEKLKDKKTVSLMELRHHLRSLNHMDTYYRNHLAGGGIHSIADRFNTFIFDPGYGGVGVSLKPILAVITMFKALELLGTETTLNDKLTKILKVVTDHSYQDRYFSKLSVDIQDVNKIADLTYNNGDESHDIAYLFETTSPAYLVAAVEKILAK